MLADAEMARGLVALIVVVLLLAAARRRFDGSDVAAGPHDVGLD